MPKLFTELNVPELSETELLVIESFCKGKIVKEVAKELNAAEWTIKTHKKNIYEKLGINTTHEMVLYGVCRKMGKSFNLKEIRKRGLSAILSVLMLYISVQELPIDYRVSTRSRTTTRAQRSGRRRSDFDAKTLFTNP